MNKIKYIKRIDTNNKVNEYIDEQTIEFILPRSKVDLASFKIYYNAYIDPVFRFSPATIGKPETYLKRFMPRLSSSIIDTLTITKDNDIIQEIKDYNVLFNIMNDALREEDNIDGDKTDTLKYPFITDANVPNRFNDFVDNEIETVRLPLNYRYFINSFLGLINESSSSIIDCSKHEIKIAIKLASRYITYRGINLDSTSSIAESYPTDYHYRLSNVFANIDVLPDDTPMLDELIFKDYHTVRDTQKDTKNVRLSYKHKGRLDYLISSFIVLGSNDTGLQLEFCNKDTDTFGSTFKTSYAVLGDYVQTPFSSKTASSKAIKLLTTENNLDNSLYFSRNALNLKTSQYFINGQAVTPMMDIPQIYGQAKDFFNNQMTRVQSMTSFESEFFVFPITVEQSDDDYCTEIVWECTEGDRKNFTQSFINRGKTYPIMFLGYTKKINLR